MDAKDIAQLRRLEEYLNFSLEFASRNDELLLLFSGLSSKGRFWAEAGLAQTADKLIPLMANLYRSFTLAMPIHYKVDFIKEFEAHFGRTWTDSDYAELFEAKRRKANYIDMDDWWTTELRELRGYTKGLSQLTDLESNV